ncbi:Fic family protein [Frankia sp. Cr2]|uniref:Fic family protein n=1 Tax=Frankia sp. Cr2 TaxID=3073932 RepID=UPI002AD21FA8|nr:Fic family protein [Frankia sp. Cr2]
MVSGLAGGGTAGRGRAEDGSAWPSLGWEEHDWVSAIPDDLVSARVRIRHQGPYRAAVVPTIADRAPSVPVHVASLADDASAEIVRFDAELGIDVASFASVLLRSESASSSRIENLTSGAKAIALAELGSTQKRNAAEIVGNVAAMKAALDLADRLDESAVLAMHAALMARHAPGIGGRWRQEQVWIGGDSYGPHGAAFIPPHHRHVPALMRDLLRFAGRVDLPVLSQAAIAHAQFETIHPFSDGNGRTGRALVHAMLRGHALTRNVTVPVSAGLLTDTTAYFDALGAYRNGDVAPIVERFATASVTAITNGRQLASELRAIRAGWDDRLKIRRDARAWRLADLILQQPVVDARVVASELGASSQNAQRVITPLAEAGILMEFTGFARNRMWQATEVLSALDAFAARAGRRVAQ